MCRCCLNGFRIHVPPIR